MTGTNIRGIIVLILLVAAVLSTAALYVFRPDLFLLRGGLSEEEQKKMTDTALHLAAQGRSDEAVAQAELVMRGSSEPNFVARSVVDTGKFMSGDARKRIEAVQLTKETYTLSKTNYEKALQVNKLLGYINAAFEPFVFDEVFVGEPFQSFLVQDDAATSIRNLAEYSISLYPTTEAQFRIGQWYTDRIRNLYGDWNATPAQKKEYAGEIAKVIASADALLPQELKTVEGRPFEYMVEPRFLFWKSYLYGVMARVQPEYLEDAKIALDALVKLNETTRDEKGAPIPLIASRLPYTYFNYALALYDVQGTDAKAEINKYLNALMTLVEKDPAVHQGYYLAFLREGGARSKADWERYYKGYIDLSELNPNFKEFLIKYGEISK
ncbi:MAG: hypothetical protein G01um10148_719 [Parcubacteria group bacterium Gr01-1014_8]|nr:MAG: hypothetical protein G01um10148_719 [Parcubacteria group bacterium Gr01-1014_8]